MKYTHGAHKYASKLWGGKHLRRRRKKIRGVTSKFTDYYSEEYFFFDSKLYRCAHFWNELPRGSENTRTVGFIPVWVITAFSSGDHIHGSTAAVLIFVHIYIFYLAEWEVFIEMFNYKLIYNNINLKNKNVGRCELILINDL